MMPWSIDGIPETGTTQRFARRRLCMPPEPRFVRPCKNLLILLPKSVQEGSNPDQRCVPVDGDLVGRVRLQVIQIAL